MIGITLLAVSLSIDALGTGLSYGVRKISLPIFAKLIICTLAYTFTALSLFLGTKLTMFLSPTIAEAIGIVVLFCMGAFVIFQGTRQKKPAEKIYNEQNNEQNSEPKKIFSFIIKSFGITIQIIRNPKFGDMDNSLSIEPIEALYIGIALSIDSLGAGIAASTLSLNNAIIPLCVALTQFVFLTIGTSAGKKISTYNSDSKVWVLVSGGLLLALAMFRVFNL